MVNHPYPSHRTRLLSIFARWLDYSAIFHSANRENFFWKRSAFFGAVRGKTSLPDSVRECAIARVAVLTHIEYEWNAHARLLLKSSDVEIGQEAVEFIGKSAPGSIKVGSSGPGGLESKHIAVLALADANTEQVKVPQEVFDAVKNFFSDKEVVELVATIAAYNCVVRFMSALEIGQ